MCLRLVSFLLSLVYEEENILVPNKRSYFIFTHFIFTVLFVLVYLLPPIIGVPRGQTQPGRAHLLGKEPGNEVTL